MLKIFLRLGSISVIIVEMYVSTRFREYFNVIFNINRGILKAIDQLILLKNDDKKYEKKFVLTHFMQLSFFFFQNPQSQSVVYTAPILNRP